eukprot:GILI01028854.1.p1 GENE.GILI01028854.1~~GILI01028854.1.p1  ORF type:complete len:224 (+),score=26.92 GILI01028854.1:34-705(+)
MEPSSSVLPALESLISADRSEDDTISSLTELFSSLTADNLKSIKNSDGEAIIHVACRLGYSNVIRLFLSRFKAKDGFLGLRDSAGRTPLHTSVIAGNLAIVEQLLLAAVDADCIDSRGRTPLHWAAEAGNEAITALLLDEDVEFDTEDNDKSTPLLLAAMNQHKPVAGMLTERGADQSILFAALKQKFGSHNFVGHEWPALNGRYMSTREGRDFPLRMPSDGS